jgi:tetratricopeptide (TPR) repeat protein/predicted Ser/Thr protein kinase
LGKGLIVTIECPKCHFVNPDDTRYCGKCGAELSPGKDVSTPRTKTLEIPKEELTAGSTFAGRYRIIEELGKGGMGNVYKALDTEINEKVAIKLIKPEISSDPKTIERFRSELKFARKIRHKNVCQMYDLNKEEGAYYITMEYVSGEDLKSFIRRAKRLDVGTAVSIAREVCEGLAEAHRLGVVHRDLKPRNIMIDNEGQVRIMDFGIARSLEAEGVTAEGAVIGTPEYMSPEQVDGKAADSRSDIYSMGVILYEAVTGTVPFKGNTPFSIALKHKSEVPPEPQKINPQVPEALSRVILKCMEKDREMRYQRAEDLLSELKEVEREIPTGERVYPKRELLLRSIWLQVKERKIITTLTAFIGGGVAVLGLIRYVIIPQYHFPKKTLDIAAVTIFCALICTLVWQWFRGVEKRYRGVKMEFFLIPAVILIAALIDISLFLSIKEPPEAVVVEEIEYENSIVVMPVVDLSSQKQKEFGKYCEGVHTAINTMLHQAIPGLRVIGKGSVMKYAGSDKNYKEIGKELDVENILEVSLQIGKDIIRVIANLIDAKSESVIHPYQEDYSYNNFFDVQSDIALAIASELKLHFKKDKFEVLNERKPEDPKAYFYYLTGQYFEKKFIDTNEEGYFQDCVKSYQDAIRIYPNYDLAYWRLGIIYEIHFNSKEYRKEDLELMERNFEKAYKINPGMAEANLGMGWVCFYKAKNNEAYDFFKKAVQQDPHNPAVNFQVGSFLFSIGLHQTAEKYYSRALQLDPFNIYCHDLLAQCYSYIGEFDKADEQIRIALGMEIEPSSLLYLRLTRLLIMMKRIAEAEAALEVAKEVAKVQEIPPSRQSDFPLLHAWILATRGKNELALGLLKDFSDSYLIEVTSIYSLLGMENKAIENIKKGIKNALKEKYAEYYTYPFLNSNPFYDHLRGNPQFLKILEEEKQKHEERLVKYGGL